MTHSFCLSAAAQSSAPVPVSACARGCAECGVRFGVRAAVPQLCTARCSGLWAAAGFCLGEKKKASSFGARMVLFHPESAALMSWLLYVPVGAMLREGSAGHERPAADRGKTLTGSGDSGPGRDGERSSGPNRVRRRMEVGGCGSELRAAGGAPAALPAGAGRSAASAEPLSAARGRCAPGDGSAARGGQCGSRCGAAEDTDCCPASPRSDPARYPCAVCTTRTRRVQPGGALGAERCREKPSCDRLSGSRDAGR